MAREIITFENKVLFVSKQLQISLARRKLTISVRVSAAIRCMEFIVSETGGAQLFQGTQLKSIWLMEEVTLFFLS